MRDQIRSLLTQIKPLDEIEKKQIEETDSWVASGAPIFRIKKPDVPDKHLISYSILVDGEYILLGEHKKSGLYLPPGGHIDVDEHPKVAAERELFEELYISPKLISDTPFFLTVSKTTVTPLHPSCHTDVTFWYLFQGNKEIPIAFDEREFSSVKWFKFGELPLERTDNHLKRFQEKYLGCFPEYNS